jgi:hypothetical protein
MNRYKYHHLRVPLSNLVTTPRIEAEAKLEKAIGDAHDVLLRATTVFPLTLFPDTVSLDRTKLTITKRGFWNAGQVMSIRIEDLLNIEADVGPFFGSLKIATRFFDPGKPYVVDHFWRADALKVKRIVQGYLIARKDGVDCSSFSSEELATKLDELGRVNPEEKV